MNYQRLKKDICYVIKEQQIKIGYRSEDVRLYYPLESLNKILETDTDIRGMQESLVYFGKYIEDDLGTIKVSNSNERFCICLSSKASDFIHENTSENGFLYDLINATRKHGISIEEIIEVFLKYSDNVHVEKIKDGEFDYLVYFEDADVDDSYFCFNIHDDHIIYHRFSREDYEEIV